LAWQFDLGRNVQLLDEFSPDVVSDGLLKAAAISLLVSLQNSPALMLEEIENGINPGNIQEVMNCIYHFSQSFCIAIIFRSPRLRVHISDR